MRFTVAILSIALLALSGCDRAVSITELNADASYKRTVKFSHQVTPGATDETPIAGLIKFKGDGWTNKTETKDGVETLTATRAVSASDSPVPEFNLVSKGTTFVESAVTAKKLPGGDIEYSETYAWIGPVKDKEKAAVREAKEHVDLMGQLKRAAPSLSDAQAQGFTEDLEEKLTRLLLGPNHPMLMSLITQPDLAAKLIRTKIFEIAKLHLIDKDGMSEADATVAARKIALEGINAGKASEVAGQSQPSDPSKGNDDPAMTLIQTEIHFPGTVVSTDGEVDPVDGSVYWAFYAAAATKKPVTLHARIHP